MNAFAQVEHLEVCIAFLLLSKHSLTSTLTVFFLIIIIMTIFSVLEGVDIIVTSASFRYLESVYLTISVSVWLSESQSSAPFLSPLHIQY